MSDGVYHPRSYWQDFKDRLDLFLQAALHWLRLAFIRLSGALVVVASSALILSLVSFHASDPSLDTASGGAAENMLGLFGATAADLMLQNLGLAILAVLCPLLMWGLRAMLGHSLSHARARIVAWVLAPWFLAGGFAVFPAIHDMPAGWGGVIGMALSRYAEHLAVSTSQGWLPLVLQPLLLLIGLVLTILAADLRPRLRRRSKVLLRRAESAGEAPLEDLPEPDEPVYDGEPEEDFTEDDPDTEDRPEPGLSEMLRVRPAAPPAPVARHKPQPSFALGNSAYEFPPSELLEEPHHEDMPSTSESALKENAAQLVTVLADFGIKGRIREVRAGPVVTLYEFEPAAGIKSSRIIALADDIARSMSAVSARVAVIPGRNVLGIELPNKDREMVFLREIFEADAFQNARSPLMLALGKTIGGEAVVTDLSKMPHLLIAGTTGSGKSVAVNTMILSLLYRLTPEQCRLIMIDPKMLELSVYDGIPHLLTPVVTDPKKAVVALKWAVREMEERYRKMSKLGVRGIEAFNERVVKAKAKGEVLKRTVQTGFDQATGKPVYEDETLELEPMPYIVVIVDEMADLMMVAGKDIEGAVQRLAQMARAAGLHLITATQRPSVDVITGTIKANFPTRISFQVTSKIDSRTILGEQGAEQLLGRGDMLYMMAGGRIKRVHGPFVADAEVEEVVKFLKAQGVPEYLEAVTEETEEEGGGDDADGFGGGNGASGDDLYDKALAIVARDRRASTSYIQRRLQIGYNRAARLVERMEEENVVSKPNHRGVREVLLPDHRGEFAED